MGVCHPSDYEHHGHEDHSMGGNGLFNMSIDYVGGAAPMETEDGHGESHGSEDGHSVAGADHSNPASDDSAHGAHGSSHRRLSGGHYSSYKECLIKECEHDSPAAL
eukprot:g26925.t1